MFAKNLPVQIENFENLRVRVLKGIFDFTNKYAGSV